MNKVISKSIPNIKVCHLTSVHMRYDVRILQKECCSLVAHGYDVSLIVNDTLPDEKYKGVKIVSTGTAPRNRIFRLLYSTKYVIKKALELDASIYCFHDPELLKYAKLLSHKGKKVIFDSHEFYALQIKEKKYIPRSLRRIVSYLYQLWEKSKLRFVDVVITPCTLSGINYFEKIAKKTVYISNVPKLEEFYYKYQSKSERQHIVCHVGSLSYERGIYHLIKAAVKANCKLILAGKYSSNKFERFIKELPEYKNIIDCGYLDRDSVYKLYQKSSIGICTLLNSGQYFKIDSFATKVYEYMAMEMPVILSDSLYAQKMNKKFNFGICVDPTNIDEIANAILYLKSHPKEAKAMGRNGRNLVKELFNWEIEEKKLLDLYDTITA